MKTKGFTLIELMIVVAIIAIFAAIFIPAFYDYSNKAKNKRPHGSNTPAITKEVVTNKNFPNIEVANIALHNRNDIYPVAVTINTDSTVRACEVYNTERCFIAKLKRHVDGILYACQQHGYCNKVEE